MGLKVFIGTSGWQYSHWKGVFYPENLKYSEWLNFYSKNFPTVEINVSFYRQIKPSTFQKWYSMTPEGFIFSVKISREITHFKRLRVNQEVVVKFLNGVSSLKEKLGVILIQLPPSLRFDESLIKDFIAMLDRAYKYTIEVRNKTFINDTFFNILKEKNIAFCISDSAGRFPYYEVVTADFVYIRLHGSERLYASEYKEEELIEWGRKISLWNRTTYLYFDNDFMGYAIKNAKHLKGIVTHTSSV